MSRQIVFAFQSIIFMLSSLFESQENPRSMESLKFGPAAIRRAVSAIGAMLC